MLFIVIIISFLNLIQSNDVKNSKLSYTAITRRKNIASVYDYKQKVMSTSIKYYVQRLSDGENIELALARISSETCFQFQETNNLTSATLIYKPGYYYSTNRKEENSNLHIIYLSYSRPEVSKIIRETLYALGIDYEHDRPDRNRYITVYSQNIYSTYLILFKRKIQSIFIKYNLGYDYKSVMHFSCNEFSKNKKKTIEAKNKLIEPFMGKSEYLTFTDAKAVNLKYCINSSLKNAKCINYGYPNPKTPYTCKCLPFYCGPHCEHKVRNFGYCSPINRFKAKYSTAFRTLHLGGTCYFFIETVPGLKIKLLLFFHHNLLTYRKCNNKEYIEVRYSKDISVSGVIYCPRVKPIIIVSEGPLIVIRSSYSSSKYKVKIAYKLA